MTKSIVAAKRNQPQIVRGQINYPLKKRIRLQNLICSQHHVQITAELALKLLPLLKKVSAAGKTKTKSNRPPLH
jgi:hypothetical protein